jgi:hypothetical protein
MKMINQKYITYNKTTSKEFDFLHLSYATAVAMATIGNFRFATATKSGTELRDFFR